MSWFFGSKKSSNKADFYVREEDGWKVVSPTPETRPAAPYPLYPTLYPPPRPAQPSPLLPSVVYPPQPGSYPSVPVQPTHVSTQSHHPLDSIPFQLSSTLDSTSSPITKFQLNSIKKQLDDITEEINSGAFRYDFKLEKSILQEEKLSSRKQ